MKIVFIGGRDIHQVGGIENYMLNLATQLVRMGHEPIVFCESDHNKETMVNGFKVIYMRGPESNLICKPWVGLKATLYTLLHERNVDIIHYNAWPPSLWSPVARICGINSLMQGHGLEWQRSKYSRFQQRIMKTMEWVTAHLNRNLIMCSDDQRRYFKEKYNRDATTIPTAINLPADTSGNESDVLNRFGLKSKRYFLFLARLVQDKNPNYLIQAFKKANANGYKLVIAGNNPANPEYVKHLHSLAERREDIVFTDAVYGDDKEILLQNAFAFCIPSTIEGLSISLLEAMSRKIPVIASIIPANKEVLDEKSALWVRPENEEDLIRAFENAVENPELLESTVDGNYKKVRDNYTWKSVAEKYIKYISSLRNERKK